MLTQERHSIILDIVNKQGGVKIVDICEQLKTSESTIRRDLHLLAQQGLLKKVHGGAIAINESFSSHERNVEEKEGLNIEEKNKIAKYAASLIEDGDFVYIDAGTTTEKMIEFIEAKNVTFVSNGFINAKRLAKRGFKVFIPAGEIKLTTEAIVGAECIISLQNYNFTKCFLGTNGITISNGFTTPDKNEANVKSVVIQQSNEVFILADSSKFGKYTAVRFASLNKATIITDKITDRKYLAETKVKEVF